MQSDAFWILCLIVLLLGAFGLMACVLAIVALLLGGRATKVRALDMFARVVSWQGTIGHRFMGTAPAALPVKKDHMDSGTSGGAALNESSPEAPVGGAEQSLG